MRITTKTEISAYPLLSRGKVRDIYDIDDKTLLIVTTDRMSAFDVIMDKPIPYKGVILNQITLFWMDKFKDIIPNHLVESDVDRFPAALAPWIPAAKGNQKASFPSPTIKGINPRIVETTVRKIGRIFEFHALVKARAGNNRGYLFLIALYSFRI